MQKITAKSKKRVIELLNPTPAFERRLAPRGLTIRRLTGRKRYADLLARFAFAVIEDEHMVCLANLTRLGFDYFG